MNITDIMLAKKLAGSGGGGGGSETMKATLAGTVDSGTGTITFGNCSKTGTELKEAIDVGIYPYIVLTLSMNDSPIAIMILSPLSYQSGSNDTWITTFLVLDVSSSSPAFNTLMVYGDGHVAFNE